MLRVFDRAGNYTDIAGTISVPVHKYLSVEITKWLQSPAGIDTLLAALVLAFLFLIAMNIALWLKLTAHKRPGGKDILKIKKVSKAKMLDFKKDLAAEDKKLEKVHTHKKLSPSEAETLKKIRTIFADTARYIDDKIKELK